ncbi:RDD family protein [Archangium primigenium]|uniref:RDD family protein n=1 Tax=[Archangium] primigenium TaxID=2792470 RepID=UPI00195CD83E|nr:RDD family protein [Archangium primigenium]MBM7118757.1 RDD family protein [Archangium primigenium]
MSQQPQSAEPQPRGAVCALHPERSAATICNRCGNYACELCFQVAPDRQDYCEACMPRSVVRPATRMSRLGAVIVDQLLLFGGALVGGIVGGISKEPMAVFVLALSAFVIVGVIQLIMLDKYGQSIGKRALDIKVVRMDGSDVGLLRLLFLRNVVPAAIGQATCSIFSLVDALAIFSEQSRCLHDYIADTQVIDVSDA